MFSGQGAQRWPAATAGEVDRLARRHAHTDITLWINAVGCNAQPGWAQPTRSNLYVAQPPEGRVEDKAATSALLGSTGVQQPRSLLVWLSRGARKDASALGLDYDCQSSDGIESADALIRSDGPGYPVVCKPVCGRGSELVEVVSSPEGLRDYARRLAEARTTYPRGSEAGCPGLARLLRGDARGAVEAAIPAGVDRDVAARVAERAVRADESGGGFTAPRYGQGFMVEEWLAGPEITVAVVPAPLFDAAARRARGGAAPFRCARGGAENVAAAIGPGHADASAGYAALTPVLRRPASDGGIMPYNGSCAVTLNSEAATASQAVSPRMADALVDAMRACERIAGAVGSRMPIRVDMRAATADEGDPSFRFLAFDVNVKPNATYPGLPGRDDQTSLLGMAADASSPALSFEALASAIVDTAPAIEDA